MGVMLLANQMSCLIMVIAQISPLPQLLGLLSVSPAIVWGPFCWFVSNCHVKPYFWCCNNWYWVSSCRSFVIHHVSAFRFIKLMLYIMKTWLSSPSSPSATTIISITSRYILGTYFFVQIWLPLTQPLRLGRIKKMDPIMNQRHTCQSSSHVGVIWFLIQPGVSMV